jgi:hypothetical protein
MRPNAHLLALFSFLLALFGAGCAPQWTVLQQANPNPFAGKTDFVVMPVSFDGLEVGRKSEEEYKAGKSDKSADSFEADKEAVAALFQQTMIADALKAGIDVRRAEGEITTFSIHPRVVFIEPGFFTVVVNRPSETRIVVEIHDPDGKVLDEILIVHGSPANMFNAASGTRLRADGEAIGGIAADYLDTRVHPDD